MSILQQVLESQEFADAVTGLKEQYKQLIVDSQADEAQFREHIYLKATILDEVVTDLVMRAAEEQEEPLPEAEKEE